MMITLSGGVIGNTTVFGSVISGSSPGRITKFLNYADYVLFDLCCVLFLSIV